MISLTGAVFHRRIALRRNMPVVVPVVVNGRLREGFALTLSTKTTAIELHVAIPATISSFTIPVATACLRRRIIFRHDPVSPRPLLRFVRRAGRQQNCGEKHQRPVDAFHCSTRANEAAYSSKFANARTCLRTFGRSLNRLGLNLMLDRDLLEVIRTGLQRPRSSKRADWAYFSATQ